MKTLARSLRALVLLAIFVVGAGMSLAVAAENPPLPRPRPADAGDGPPPGADADRQRLIREGIADGGTDSLFPPTDPRPLGTTPQRVTLQAQVTEKGAQIGAGLVWRIFDTRPDRSGQLVLVAKSDEAAPRLELKPGDYVVHVAYGRAQASDALSVRDTPEKKDMILDVGGLKLNAAITGDIAIPLNLLRFDVFTTGVSNAERAQVAEKIGPGDVLTLNAGTYHIVSYFGDVNAIVRADLRVEPGQLTEATLYQKAAQISFKLVSEVGGEAIADVDWTVKDATGETVFTNTGAFPATVLEEGDYTVLAKRGDKVYNRAFAVVAGKTQDVAVLTTVY